MTETAEDFDIEQFRLPPSLYNEIQTHQYPPRPVGEEPYIKGPIPFAWAALAARLPGSCLIVGMAARYLRGRYPHKRGWSVAEIGWRAGLEEQSARRALRTLSEAGLIALTREPGRKPVLNVLESAEEKEPETRRYPLWGPIPWPWWRAASQLSGKAPHVALACWLLAGWERSARIELEPVWPELGLTQPSTYRGLEALEAAGLVYIIRQRGRSPIVLIVGPNSPKEDSCH
jgi:DNA-binding transcriptional ArsR family regulator